MKNVIMSMTIWIWILLVIIFMTAPAYATEPVSIPDAGIFWLLGPAMLFLGILGKKKK